MFRQRLSAALITALGMAAHAQSAIGRIIMPQVPRTFKGEIDLPPMSYGYKGAGVTMAQQKRASKKARNVKRHKAACRK